MAKFNSASKTRTGVQSPIKSTTTVARTGNGALGYARTEKSELFLLAVSNFVGQDTFYEKALGANLAKLEHSASVPDQPWVHSQVRAKKALAEGRDDRFSRLVSQTALEDPRWTLGFIGWLRNDAFMRSASIVAAVEAGQAYKALGEDKTENWSREFVAAAQARADEPGEVFAYYEAKYGKPFPAWLKKGVADGARKLYNEYSLLKYDTDSKGYRFADVLQLAHVKPKDARQSTLFGYALDRRYNNVTEVPAVLRMTNAREGLMKTDVKARKSLLNSLLLKDAGMTWEALSGWLNGPMDAQAWEAVIPSMGHMALLRNLRNFLQAGVSQKVLRDVLNRISDPEQVAKGKQFPFRYLAAYQANKGNLKVSAALEDALQASLANVPELSGRTLILVDRSGSMFWSNDQKMDLTFADQAAIFGSALALRAEDATLVQFGSSSAEVSFRKTDSVLPMLSKFRDLGGTSTAAAVKRHFNGHDRVIIVTDEQYSGVDPSGVVPKNVPLYTWNLNGYKVGGFSGESKRHTFGGLTDKAFQQIPLIEAGQQAKWPWELDAKR